MVVMELSMSHFILYIGKYEISSVISTVSTSDTKTYENLTFPKGSETPLRDANRICIVFVAFELDSFKSFI